MHPGGGHRDCRSALGHAIDLVDLQTQRAKVFQSVHTDGRSAGDSELHLRDWCQIAPVTASLFHLFGSLKINWRFLIDIYRSHIMSQVKTNPRHTWVSIGYYR